MFKEDLKELKNNLEIKDYKVSQKVFSRKHFTYFNKALKILVIIF